MANVRDSDTSLWLHNKLGTSNDSWISGSICSQLNKEVLRNIKECFSDLQTQVKLKLLLSFFHIPRRLVEEWKTELEEVIEVAGIDSELWVSMLAESMKTFPANSALNTEISDYEDTRPIFTDMVNDLRKLVAKHSDLGMLPLECQYLNKNALISVVGQQSNPVKHFTIKRKPKSAALRTELLHKSADAQSSLKKSSAPTIPLRSRGMPRKMTDTTPLKGIPSRMPTSGFRSANINPNNQQRPNLSRTPAGRKDGGIKLIEFTEQPLGYVAAKKRKREQQLEEQAKKQEQKAAAAAAAAAAAGNESPPASALQSIISSGSGEAVGNNNNNTAIGTLNNNFEIKIEPTTQTSTNSCMDENFASGIDSKDDIQQEIMATRRGQKLADAVTLVAAETAGATHTTTTTAAKTPTPEYAPPSLSYTTQTSGVSLIDSIDQSHANTIADDIKPHTQKLMGRLRSSEKINSSNSNNNNIIQQQNQKNSNNNNNNSSSINSNNNNTINGNNLNVNSHKRIKQEIEIKSEEILVPANIKVEKLDMPPIDHQVQTTQSLLQRITQQQQQLQQQQAQLQLQTQMPQRIIIQQQHQQQQSLPILQHIQTTQTNQQQQNQQQHHQLQPTTQQVIIRTTPQTTPKQTLTLRQQHPNTVNATPIKMEKLEIKPLLRSSIGQISQGTTILRSNAATSTTATAAATTNSNNPLANLPNNISVKITSTKSNKVNQAQQTVNVQQPLQQQPQQQILINSSTPVILASTPAQVAALRQKQLTSNSVTVQNATPQTAQALKSMPLSQLKNATNSGPVIISQTIIQPAKRSINNNPQQQQHQLQQQQQQTSIIQSQQQQNQSATTQYILSQSPSIGQQQQHHHPSLSTITTYTPTRLLQQQQQQQSQQQSQIAFQQSNSQTPTSTKILLKTVSPSSGVVIRQQQQTQTGPPPLIASTITNVSTSPTLLNIQNVQLPNRPVTIQPASQAAQQQHLQAQLQQQQQQQQHHTLVSNNTATQQPKLTQVLMQTAAAGNNSGGATISTQGAHLTNAASAGTIGGTSSALKNKTIIVTQKGLILRNIAGDMYEQIPISSVSGLQTLNAGGTGTLMTTASNPSSLVKTTTVTALPQTQMITLQPQPQQQSTTAQVTKAHLSTLMPTQSHMIVQQQPQVTTSLLTNQQPTQQTIIRPVMANVQSGLANLPSGLTLIQRPGQQPQLIQVQTASAIQQAPIQQTQIQRTIIAQPALQQKSQQQQLRPQQIVLQQKPGTTTQRIITTATAATLGGQQIQLQQTGTGNVQRIIQTSQQQQQQQQPQIHATPQRKGLSLSNEHVHKAHEMFRKANRVSRPDKALILGFMAGVRENPRPNSENVLVIKLGETEEKMQQEDGSTALCLVESHIRLDYNTGEWKTFQNYRRLDQGCTQSNITGDPTNTNTVVI